MSQTLHHRPQQGYTSIHPVVDLVNDIACLAAANNAADGGDAAVSEVSATPSNPDQWREKRSRKMHDLQLHYSCDPLRVLNSGSKHDANLHATLSTVLPQPHGGVKEFRQHVSHVSDATIVQQAQKLCSTGVSSTAPSTAASKQQQKNTPSPSGGVKSAATTPSSVAEASRRVLESQTGMKRLPNLPPQQQLPPGIIRPPPPNSAKVCEDGASVFSVTTTGMRTTVSGSHARPLSNPVVSTNSTSRSSTAPAAPAEVVTSRTDASQQQAGDAPRPSAGSRCGSNASTNLSRANSIAKKIEDEKESNQSIAEHVREAAKQLDRIEKLLGRRELPFTHN